MLNLMNQIESLMYDKMRDMAIVPAAQLGLDSRCGAVYVSDDCIVTRNNKNLSYYGGFEYCGDEYKTVIGDFTIYSVEDERVEEAISFYNDQK